ncbi:hypothetical protein [Streptomyces sp. NPDC002491]
MLRLADVAAVVSTMRGKFARRYLLAEAHPHLLETLRAATTMPDLQCTR